MVTVTQGWGRKMWWALSYTIVSAVRGPCGVRCDQEAGRGHVSGSGPGCIGSCSWARRVLGDSWRVRRGKGQSLRAQALGQAAFMGRTGRRSQGHKERPPPLESENTLLLLAGKTPRPP